MAANANANETVTATFFMWGNGNGSTTFNLPDYRGLIPMGNNIMGGVASSNINDTYFGSTSASSAGAKGGNVGGGQNLSLAQLPTGITSSNASQSITVTPVGSFIPLTPGAISSVNTVSSGSFTVPITGSGSWSGTGSLSGTNNITVTSNNTSGSLFSIVPPSRTTNFIIKITLILRLVVLVLLR